MAPKKTQKLPFADRQAVGRRIAARRHTKSWSQRDLARRTGVSHTRLSKLETGQATPSLAEMLVLADALDSGLDELGRGVPAADSALGRHLLPPLQELEDLASPEECAILGKLFRLLLAGFRATRPLAAETCR